MIMLTAVLADVSVDLYTTGCQTALALEALDEVFCHNSTEPPTGIPHDRLHLQHWYKRLPPA